MKIFNWEKNKTLYRYLKNGDLFCFKIADKLFGYGRIILSYSIIKMLEITQFYSKPF